VTQDIQFERLVVKLEEQSGLEEIPMLLVTQNYGG
jgi:hypothetical protein